MTATTIAGGYEGAWARVRTLLEDGTVTTVFHEGGSEEAERIRLAAQQLGSRSLVTSIEDISSLLEAPGAMVWSLAPGAVSFVASQLYQLVIICQTLYTIDSKAHDKGDSYYADGGRDLLHTPGGSK
jgi:hypothetical protein